MGWNWTLPVFAIMGLFKFHETEQNSLFSIFLIPTLLLLFFSGLLSYMSKRKMRSVPELMARTITFWWMLVSFMIGVSTHRSVSYLIIAVISAMACFEYFSFGRKIGDKKSIFLLEMFIYLLIPINLAVQYFLGGAQSDVLNLFVLVAVLPSVLVLSNQSEDATLKFGKYSQAFLFFVYGLGCAGAIINIDIKILLICLILTELRDLISYWMGKFFGKLIARDPKGIIQRILNCKIAEKVSPNKTWAVGGLSTVFLCLLVMTLPPTFFTFGSKTMSSGFLISWTAVIGASGLFGDLIFSLMKREYGVKDSGQMLPGKSGVIDRIDSLAVTFPVTYFLLLNFPPS